MSDNSLMTVSGSSGLGHPLLAVGAEGGGAALDQVFAMTAATGVVFLGLLWIGILHRTRRITWLGRLADWTGSIVNRPGWAALPLVVFISTILTAFLGFIWDVSLHAGKGRDPGPLANPAHYFILVGLFFLFIAGSLAVILPLDEKPGPAAVKITRTWYAPVGGLLIAGSGLYALIAFPLDDIWHRIFGQDVTLWSPTHLMLIGGAGLSLIGVLLLEHEGKLARPDRERNEGLVLWLMRGSAFGGLLIGLSVFQIEFDFGIQQFRLVLQPMLITGAAALALVGARLTIGRGAAIYAAVFAIVVRAITAVIVGPFIGAPHNVFPLYLGAAVVVELLALTPLVSRPVVFGAVGGFGVATIGMWIESWWISAAYENPWPVSMWAEALAMAIPVGVVTGVVGALLAMVLTEQKLPSRPLRVGVVLAMVLILAGATANGIIHTVPARATGTVTLTDAEPADGRMVTATVHIDPNDTVGQDPEWVSLLAWQGGVGDAHPDRGLVIDRLERTGTGEYRSTKAIPVNGKWKTVLRLQDGRMLSALPVYLPNDPGIGATETPATSSFTRPFVSEITVLQRERNFDVPTWLYGAASMVVLICSLILVASLSWGAGRIARSTRPTTPQERKTPVDTVPR